MQSDVIWSEFLEAVREKGTPGVDTVDQLKVMLGIEAKGGGDQPPKEVGIYVVRGQIGGRDPFDPIIFRPLPLFLDR